MAEQEWAPPEVPNEPLQEGARWRYHRPSSSAVAEWFATQPLDEGMDHTHYVGGVVLIPANEKVTYTRPDGGQVQRYEQTFTPYVQIGTRVGYFRRLAEHRGLIPVIEPAPVPRSKDPRSPYFNSNMEEGLWWHLVAGSDGNAVRYLCATAQVGLYDKQSYLALINKQPALPVISGRGTKQVGGGPDVNMIARAQTGAVGRALGVAGILVIGTGIATAEDMQEFAGYGGTSAAPSLPAVPSEIAAGEPPPVDPSAQFDQLKSRALALQTQLQEQSPEQWSAFLSWWQERAKAEGWSGIDAVPYEALKGVVSRMERTLAEVA